MDTPLPHGRKLITVVVPVFDEADAIDPFLAAMDDVRDEVERRFAGSISLELMFIDDGSRDGTRQRLRETCETRRDIGLIELSRNFGKEAALTAGMAEARGDAVVLIDVDLQDPPNLIPDLIARWREGARVVLAHRIDRSEDSAMKRRTARWFYALHNRISDIEIPADVGDFRLMDRIVVDQINRLPESRRFMKGIFAWIGFEAVTVEYRRPARTTGQTKFSGWKLWRFAIEGITSFSTVPLVVWTYVGFAISALSLAYASLIVISTLLYGREVPGYASLIVAILFMGGVQILGIGIMGEYVGRIYTEAKRRPAYIVSDRHGVSAPKPHPVIERQQSHESTDGA